MGEVFKAHDPVLNRFVAVKTIVGSLDANEDLRLRFQREAQSAARLNHPNIITVYDFGEEEGKIFMAMELLEGTDLREIIKSQRPLNLHQRLRLMEQICDGLGFAHAKEIVHRDLKPGNVHIQPNGQVKIMDFGLARLASSDMTKTGLIMGTPNYMSPEQVQGKRVDSRSDVFSLGAVFYELFSHRKPFAAESIHATMFKVVQCEREPLVKWVPDLPPSLVQLVDKTLAMEPIDRFQNATEVRDALRVLRKELGEPSEESDSDWGVDLQETVVSETSQMTAPAPSRTPVPVGGSSRPSARTYRPAEVSSSQVVGGRPTSWYVGGALGAVVLGALAFFLLRPSPTPVDGTESRQQIDALTDALVQSQVELATASLDSKEYQAALEQAETVLANDPSHPEALRIQEEVQAIFADLDVTAAEARTALAEGRTDDAAEALAQVLSVDASHPVAADLTGQLNSQFRSKAEAARRQTSGSRKAAEAAGGARLSEFQQADRLVGESQADFNQQQFALATQKLLKARDLFERARRSAAAQEGSRQSEAEAARARLEQVARQWSALMAQNGAPELTRQPSFQAALAAAEKAKRQASQGDFDGASQTYRQAMGHLDTAKQQVARDRAAADAQARAAAAKPPPPPVESAPPPAPRPVPTVAQADLDDAAIREVIANYERAIESKDVALFKAVKPNLSNDELRRLESSFKSVDSHQIDITIASIDVQGDRAAVRLARRDTIVFNGNNRSTQAQQTIVLSKGPNGWAILEITQ
jgi:serine/threonine protein kinase